MASEPVTMSDLFRIVGNCVAGSGGFVAVTDHLIHINEPFRARVLIGVGVGLLWTYGQNIWREHKNEKSRLASFGLN